MLIRHKSKFPALAVLVLLLTSISTASSDSFAQEKAKTKVCKPAVLAASKPLPKLRYQCNADLSDYDQKVLKAPNRIVAIKVLERRLETFTSPAWWQATVDDLSLCELRRKPGVLSAAEEEKLKSGDYIFDLFGNHSLRLVLLKDPCYQMEYFGSNAFLLYRNAGKVFVTQVLDGFFSRADNPVGLEFADLKGQQIIEVATGSGGMHPSVTNYYFVIDPATNRAVPKKLFQGDKGPTNEISSDLLMGAPEDLELPKDAVELGIIREHKMAPAFSIYAEDSEGKIDAPGGKMTRTILKWNGHIYQ